MIWLTDIGITWFVMLGILLVTAIVYRQIWKTLHRRASQTHSILDTAFLEAIHKPFYALVLLFMVYASVPMFTASVFEVDPNLTDMILPFGFAFFVLIVFNQFLSNIQATIVRIEKNDVMPNSGAWVSACKVGRLISILGFVLVMMSLFNIPMGQVLAPTAVGALALSFASKDLLSNVFGGLMVMMDRPFSVGDYVKIGNNEEGTVRYIGWRMTEVQLLNGRILHVPNGVITTAVVTNFSEKTHWYVQKEIGVRYQDLAVSPIIAQHIEAWISQHAYTNQRRVSFAKVFNLSESSVTIRIRVYLKSSINSKQWYMFVEELLLQVGEIVKAQGADFAFPTQTIHMESVKEKE